MFIRRIPPEECPIHPSGRCRSARMFGCEECGTEYIAHRIVGGPTYCSTACRIVGTEKVRKRAEEYVKRRRRVYRKPKQ